MTEKRYRAAIIGLGYIGCADQVSGDALGQNVEDLDRTHAVALRNHPAVELVAGSSRDAGWRARFTERTDVPTYADWRTMLTSEPLDIMSVATYTPIHAEITATCAKQGVCAVYCEKPIVYCEKPIAPTVVNAGQMVPACADAGTLNATQ